MTHADTGALALVGRSRDTGSSGSIGAPFLPVWPPITPLSRVVLRLWALTPRALADADTAARSSVNAGLWDIRESVPSVGGVCPIPLRDPLALGQGAYYGWAWAAYPAGRSDA